MSTAPAAKPATKTKDSIKKTINASTQARFTTSKLIQNLGSSNDGVQFNFISELRTVHGRD